ncbi:MAG TPA: hypothetical protein VMW70_06545 [Burkholderiales bacterium]|nr:hypothetical protein [Burkholderiales bacterium]
MSTKLSDILTLHVMRHFAESSPMENTVRVYLRNLQIQEAIYASSAKGRRIVIDESVLDVAA